MPFYLYQSNDLESLAEKLASICAALQPRAERAHDPFRKEVVVADRPLFRWLQMQIAKRNVICPALELLRPGRFLYEFVFSAIESPLPETMPLETDDPPFNPDSVRWRIFALLASKLEAAPEFARVKKFVAGDSLRRFQLSSRLAQLFDKYMTDRLDVLAKWEAADADADAGAGADAEANGDMPWQSILWRELIAQTPGKTLHFSGLFAKFKSLMSASAFASAPPPQKFPALAAAGRVCVFTATPLPPAHIDILRTLAARGIADVHFFALNPCKEFWGDAKRRKHELRENQKLVELYGESADAYLLESNPLLGNFGRIGRDFFARFADEFAPDFEDCDFHEYDFGTLLGGVQNAVLNNELGNGESKLGTGDWGLGTGKEINSTLHTPHSTLSLHSCHSPMREVEALRDQMLALFTNDPTLQPSDVRVVVSDIDAYAPCIDAVFSPSAPAAPRIPFAISGSSAKNAIPEFRAFETLLAAALGRFKASEILALLNHEPIRRRFGFSDDDRQRLPLLLKRAGLAWGLDAQFRAAQGAAADYANTWRFALDRLILGAAMGGSAALSADTLDGIVSLDGGASQVAPLPNTASLAPLIGKTADLLAAVESLAKRLAAPDKPCAQWLADLYSALDSFFDAGSDSAPGLAALRETFAALELSILRARCAETPAAFAVLRACLKEKLDSSRAETGAEIGFVRFAPFNSASAVPARVVCFLGMNNGAFPRNPAQLSLDITDKRSGFPLAGDRPLSDQDRYAFLLSLMSARERALIFYAGQSAKDNSELPPSVIVSELIDFANTILRPAGLNALRAVKHPLHPFSPKYFNADSALFSFNKNAYETARKISAPFHANSPSPPPSPCAPPALPATILLDDLVKFLTSPCNHFYANRLGVRLEIKDADAPDDDGYMEFDTLENYGLANRMLQALDAAPGAAPGQIRARLSAEGGLPADAEKSFDTNFETVKRILGIKFKMLATDSQCLSPSSALIPLPHLGVSIEAMFSSLHAAPDGSRLQIFCRPADIKGKDVIKGRLHHLALVAAQPEAAATWVIAKDGARVFGPAEAPTRARAIERLSQLAALYLESAASDRPSCFESECGFAWAGKSGDDAQRAAAAAAKYEPGDFGGAPQDACLIHACGESFYDLEPSALDELVRFSKIVFAEEYENSLQAKTKAKSKTPSTEPAAQ